MRSFVLNHSQSRCSGPSGGTFAAPTASIRLVSCAINRSHALEASHVWPAISTYKDKLPWKPSYELTVLPSGFLCSVAVRLMPSAA
jgi:hypothetical protein